MKITVIGAGYVGLVSAACFSDFGYEVTCVDRDARKVAALESGKIPIYEQGLEPIVAANRAAGRLIFTDSMKDVNIVQNISPERTPAAPAARTASSAAIPAQIAISPRMPCPAFITCFTKRSARPASTNR